MNSIKKILLENKEKIAAGIATAISAIIVLLCSSCVVGGDAVKAMSDCVNGVCQNIIKK